MVPLREVFWYFFRLGWLAFGGPVGQIGLMHLEVVERRKWLDEDEFLRALNFCHVLPGPEATQLAIYVGYRKRGYLGGILAGVLFILPGFITLSVLGWIYVRYGNAPTVKNVLWGFRPVGLALLLAALVRISRAALKGPLQVALAAASFVAFFFFQVPFLVVLLGCGLVFLGTGRAKTAAAMLLPVKGRLFDISWFFLKVGLFSFGGAYAVLPYLREGAVTHYGWIADRQMIDALALGETTPGPLISIGIFVGYLAGHAVGAPWLGAGLATFWLFLPSFVFVLAAARWMNWLTAQPGMKEFLQGVTAGVVGLMFSISIPLAKVAFMPEGRIDGWTVALGLAAFAALTLWKWRLNVVAVVLGGGVLGLLRALAPALFGVLLVSSVAFAQPFPPAQPGALQVGTLEPGAEIFIEGHDTGKKTPAVIGPLLPGEYEIEVHLGPRRGTALVEVVSGETAGLHVRLSGRAPVDVASEPPGAEVYLDNRDEGETPLQLEIPHVEYGELELVHSGFKTAKVSVTEATTSVSVDLAPADWSIRWSLAYPFFELDHRMGDQFWIGGRAFIVGAVMAPLLGGDIGAALWGGLSFLLQYRMEPPGSLWGLELFGGPTVAGANELGCCDSVSAGALIGAAFGIAGRVGPFELILEADSGLFTGTSKPSIQIFTWPMLALRHDF